MTSNKFYLLNFAVLGRVKKSNTGKLNVSENPLGHLPQIIINSKKNNNYSNRPISKVKEDKLQGVEFFVILQFFGTLL